MDNQILSRYAKGITTGGIRHGRFLRGASKLPFGDAMRSGRERMDDLLNGRMPAA